MTLWLGSQKIVFLSHLVLFMRTFIIHKLRISWGLKRNKNLFKHVLWLCRIAVKIVIKGETDRTILTITKMFKILSDMTESCYVMNKKFIIKLEGGIKKFKLRDAWGENLLMFVWFTVYFDKLPKITVEVTKLKTLCHVLQENSSNSFELTAITAFLNFFLPEY